MNQVIGSRALNSYTPEEVAKMCGVKTSTVYAWISRREITAIKVGRRRYITEESIRDMYAYRRGTEYVDYRYSTRQTRGPKYA